MFLECTAAVICPTPIFMNSEVLKSIMFPFLIPNFTQIIQWMWKASMEVHLLSSVWLSLCTFHITHNYQINFCIHLFIKYYSHQEIQFSYPLIKIPFTELIFMKLTTAPEIFVKNSYIGFHENLAKAFVTDTMSRTDGQTWPPHQVLSFVSQIRPEKSFPHRY